MAWVFIGVGLALLLIGSSFLSRGASGLFRSAGMSSLLIALVAVSAAVSAPELFVALQASMRADGYAAFGMVIGSSLANILLILGLGALLGPMPVPPRVVFRDCIALLFVSAALLFAARAGTLNATFAIALLAGFAIYIAVCVITERRRHAPVRMASARTIASDEQEQTSAGTALLLTLGGLGLLFFGARFIIDAGLSISRAAGIPDNIAGLILIALATALPELVITVSAVRRYQAQATASQLIASSIFNLTLVLGVLALLSPIHLDARFTQHDVFVLLAAAVALPMFATGWRISRLGGALLIAGYVAWLGAVVWQSGLLFH